MQRRTMTPDRAARSTLVFFLSLVLGVAGGLLAACSTEPPPADGGEETAVPRAVEPAAPEVDPAEVDPATLARARGAAKALAQNLAGRLKEELEAGGPAAAVEVCSQVAQEMAAEHSTGGLTVRRVSRKVRNPADRPDPWERQQLERLAELHRREELPEEVVEVLQEDDRRTLRYLWPIVLQPMCLQCHGDPTTFDPATRQLLEERYPEDEAVGYEVGDLRGAVSVTVDLES